MMWLTRRQFRTQMAVVFGLLMVVAIVLALTGTHLLNLYDIYIRTCRADHNCGSTLDPALTTDARLQAAVPVLLVLLPALTGIFWGAPLVARELESGTYRLAWTQSISRDRWLMMKIGVVGVASVAASGLLSLMLTWWASPMDAANANRFGVGEFGLRGIVPIGYAAFAFALGLAAGVIARRSVPAMAVTFVAYVGGRLAEAFWVRPHLMSPLHISGPLAAVNIGLTPSGPVVTADPGNLPNAWAYSASVVNNAGQAPTAQFIKQACPNLGAGAPSGASVSGSPLGGGKSVGVAPNGFQQCVAHIGAKFHEVVTYQPASRYWAFQGLETALFVVLAVALVGVSFWWVRRRLS